MTREKWSALMQTAGANFLILTAAMLIAVWVRLRIAIGNPLGADYRAQSAGVYLLLLLSALLAYGIAAALPAGSRWKDWLDTWRQYRQLGLAVGCACLLIGLLLPDISQLQLVYFAGSALVIGVLVVVLPTRLRASAYIHSTTLQDVREIYNHRQLILIWLRFRVQARYSQTILGILWIIVLPLSMALIMAFAFTQLLGRSSNLNVPFVAFLLSGQVMFGVFSHVVSHSRVDILSLMDLIQQVYFPREIVLLLILGEALVDFLFTFVAMLLINALLGIPPTIHLLLLPLPIFLMSTLSLGIGFIVSWLSLLIRDMQQLITVALQLLFYVTVLFSAENVDPRYEFLMSINPVSAIVEAFRDMTIYARTPDPVRLYLPVVLAFVILYFGYTFFKVNEDRLVDYA